MSKATSDILDFITSADFAQWALSLFGGSLLGVAFIVWLTGRKDRREERDDLFRD